MKDLEFKDFITLQRGFDLPEHSRIYGDVPVVASTSITSFHNIAKVSAPGVVTGRSGALGEVQYIDKDFWPLNTTLWVKDFKHNEPKYVYYFLKTLDLKRFNSGAGVPTLNRNDLDTLKIKIHEPSKQKIIAKILSNYDDLIENNNKRIKILEEMAQKIYKEWFVDFKFPGHETATFKQTELGKIPSDWEVVTVDKFCNIFTGKKNANAAIKNGKYKFYTCAPEPLLIDTYIHDDKAVIIAGNGSYTGRTLFYDGKFDLYQRTYACTIKENDIDDYIYTLYAVIKNSLEKDISGGTHGAAVPYIVFDDIAKHQFAFNKRIFDKSSIMFKQIFNAILIFNKKNETLKQTRDLLLPRLISGEIDVENLEVL